MATNTSKYNLVKPADSEVADIAVINGNMDKIDAGIYGARPIIVSGTKGVTGTLTLSDSKITTAHEVTGWMVADPAAVPRSFDWDTDTAGEVHIKGTWLKSTTISVKLEVRQ